MKLKYVVCDACPCLNNDYEYGEDCNLNFGVKYRLVYGTNVITSTDCRLDCVQVCGNEINFEPKWIETEVDHET